MKRECARKVGGQRGSLLKEEMKEKEQRNKQDSEQKSKSVGRTSLINFLKRKVLPMTVKKGREWVKKREDIKQEKEGQRRQIKSISEKEIGRHSNRGRMKEARENEKSQSVGKVRLI